ncbi:MAG: hypothetical protein ACUVQ5_05340 [Candidatus Methanomethylicaceae archaeon]
MELIVKAFKSNKKVTMPYELIITKTGYLSVPFVLASITFFFAYGAIPNLFLPSLMDPLAFSLLIISFIVGIILHEFSHVVILTNRNVTNISIGLSISGIWGGFIKADIDPETYSEIQIPFYSSGLGLNLLLFLVFFPFVALNAYLHIISVANFWLLLINGIPAPLMDGGKVFEVTLRRLNLEGHVEFISIGVLLLWFFIILYRFLTS